MNTPICDFVRDYAKSGAVRLHMPGHKGKTFLGPEEADVTEIDGADALYLPHGIIRESERNASRLFGCDTYYSAEGSSLCIRAMLLLALRHTRSRRVLAGRNAHSTFLSAAALLDLSVRWLHPHAGEGCCACTVTAADLEQALEAEPAGAVYITSPDYLGNIADVAALSDVCRRHGALLLVDNAHGAYLRFLPQSRHPIDLGADLCCDSAHKTLPVLTGGAYLHIADCVREAVSPHAKNAMALFGSTSPSYLILQSLDNANRILETYRETLAAFLPKTDALRQALRAHGYTLCGTEPLKVTIRADAFGCTGDALAAALAEQNIFCEFHDGTFLTAMLSPANGDGDLTRFRDALCALPQKTPLDRPVLSYRAPQSVLSVREAALAPSEIVPVERSVGRIFAQNAVSCPPAVPIVLAGERIDAQTAETLRLYGVTECAVVREEDFS